MTRLRGEKCCSMPNLYSDHVHEKIIGRNIDWKWLSMAGILPAKNKTSAMYQRN